MLDETSTAYLQAINDGDLARADELRNLLDTTSQLEQNRPALLHRAALRYARAGIAVFPLKPRGKTPLTAHGFKDATTNLEQINAWWTATPDANIGLPTGITFDVFDIDGPEGLAGMFNGADAPVDHIQVRGHALTSRDGGHHLYVPVTGRGNGTRIMPGVDYRGLGGYVVAPPSIGATGRRYIWTQQLAGAV